MYIFDKWLNSWTVTVISLQDKHLKYYFQQPGKKNLLQRTKQVSSQILSPWLDDLANSGIGWSHRPASYIDWRAGTTTLSTCAGVYYILLVREFRD